MKAKEKDIRWPNKWLSSAIKIAGQWRFKKEIIDKWINEGSLENLNKDE